MVVARGVSGHDQREPPHARPAQQPRTRASGGPPSNRTALPSGCWIRVASPWPTSRKETVNGSGGPGAARRATSAASATSAANAAGAAAAEPAARRLGAARGRRRGRRPPAPPRRECDGRIGQPGTDGRAAAEGSRPRQVGKALGESRERQGSAATGPGRRQLRGRGRHGRPRRAPRQHPGPHHRRHRRQREQVRGDPASGIDPKWCASSGAVATVARVIANPRRARGRAPGGGKAAAPRGASWAALGRALVAGKRAEAPRARMPPTAANESCHPGSPDARGFPASVAPAASSSAYQREAGRERASAASPAAPMSPRAGATGPRRRAAHTARSAPAAPRASAPAKAPRREERQRQRGEEHHVLAAHREQVGEPESRQSSRVSGVDRLVLAEHHAARSAASPAGMPATTACSASPRMRSSPPASPPRRRPVGRAGPAAARRRRLARADAPRSRGQSWSPGYVRPRLPRPRRQPGAAAQSAEARGRSAREAASGSTAGSVSAGARRAAGPPTHGLPRKPRGARPSGG